MRSTTIVKCRSHFRLKYFAVKFQWSIYRNLRRRSWKFLIYPDFHGFQEGKFDFERLLGKLLFNVRRFYDIRMAILKHCTGTGGRCTVNCQIPVERVSVRMILVIYCIYGFNITLIRLHIRISHKNNSNSSSVYEYSHTPKQSINITKESFAYTSFHCCGCIGCACVAVKAINESSSQLCN